MSYILLRALLTKVAGTIITPGVGSVSVGGIAPTADIGITPTVVSLSLSGTVTTQGLGISPSTGSLAVTGQTPGMIQGQKIVVSVGSVSLTPTTSIYIINVIRGPPVAGDGRTYIFQRLLIVARRHQDW